MKVKTAKLDKLLKIPKPLKIGVLATLLLIVFLFCIIKIKGNNKSSSFYKDLNSFTKTEICSFRCTLNINTENLSLDNSTEDSETGNTENGGNTGASNINLEDYFSGTESQEDSDSMFVENNTEHDTQVGSLYADRINTNWGTADGNTTVDWGYPHYEMSISGTTYATEPLDMSVNIGLRTELIDAEFTDIICKDGKVYFNVDKMRTWFRNCKDSGLVSLADKLPDNIVYIEIDETTELDLSTVYKEKNDTFEEQSGYPNLMSLYRSLVYLEQMICGEFSNTLGNKCHSVDTSNDSIKCRLNLTGTDADLAVKQYRKFFINSGAYYDKYYATLENNKLIKNIMQANAEKDNFIFAQADRIQTLSSLTDTSISALNTNILGKSSRYKTAGGNQAIEVSLGVTYQYGDTAYVIAFKGYKETLSSKESVVTVPTETIMKYTNLGEDSISNLTYIKNKLGYYLKLKDANTEYTLDYTDITAVERDIVNSIIKMINARNAEISGGLVLQDVYSLQEYLDVYGNMTEKDSYYDEVRHINYTCARDVKEIFNTLFADKSSGSDTEGNSWCGVTKKSSEYDNVVFDVTTDTEKTTSRLIVLNLDIRNFSGADYETALSKWYLTDRYGNKYPCNNLLLLRDMDSNFDTMLIEDKHTINNMEGIKTATSNMTTEQIWEYTPERVQLYIVIGERPQLILYNDKDEEIGTIHE